MNESTETRYHFRQVKSVIRRGYLPDSFVASRYTACPYMACEHACKYCDGRAERYWIEGNFERDIVIRENFHQIFENELLRLREKGPVSFGSGVSDPYQPVEATEALMAKAAKLLYEHHMPGVVMTKSALVRRDLDLWNKVNERAGFTLCMSLTFTDDHPRSLFEPVASSVQERLDTLLAFKEAGCRVGVLAMPFLPGISDAPEQLDDLYKTLSGIGVDFIMPGGLTLRPGRQKDLFLEVLDHHYPHLSNRYREIFAQNLRSGAPSSSYGHRLRLRLAPVIEKYGIPSLVPHAVYRDRLPLQDSIHILLSHMTSLYREKGIDTTPLRSVLKKFSLWLKEERKLFHRRRKLPANTVERLFQQLLGEKSDFFGNQKLLSFVREVALEGRVFDYIRLTLEDSPEIHPA